jgi:hypothetical protein
MIKNTMQDIQETAFYQVAGAQPTPDGDPDFSGAGDGLLDGTAGHLNKFLQELVSMVEPDADHDSGQALELRFGDVVTRSAVVTIAEASCLSIVAVLARTAADSSGVSCDIGYFADAKSAIAHRPVWSIDSRRQVLRCAIPVDRFSTETDVFNAIISVAEQAERRLSFNGENR